MVVELRWWLGFGFEAKLAWRGVGRCTLTYMGVCEESGMIKIQIGDKIQVYLKNKIP
jgi:hypothetical protein